MTVRRQLDRTNALEEIAFYVLVLAVVAFSLVCFWVDAEAQPIDPVSAPVGGAGVVTVVSTVDPDMIFPVTGSVGPHDLQWTVSPLPDGLFHVTHFTLETRPLFGAGGWTPEAGQYDFSLVCRTTIEDSSNRLCQVPMRNGLAQYCLRACNGAVRIACYPEPYQPLKRCCHGPAGAITCYTGFTQTPSNCS